MKDTILPPDPNTGREQSTVSWEYDFRAQDPDIVQNLNLASEQNLRSEEHDLKLLFIPWNEFKPTYRGREVADPEPLKTNQVRRISIMMRRYVQHCLPITSIDLCFTVSVQLPITISIARCPLTKEDSTGVYTAFSHFSLTHSAYSFFATQSGSFKLDVVSIATLSSTSTGITAAQTVPASVSRSECESETTTLQGEYSDRKDDTGSAYPGNQGQSAPQGFWSKLLCR